MLDYLKKFFFSSSVLMYNGNKNDYAIAKLGYSFSFLLSIFVAPWIVPLFRRDYVVFIIFFLGLLAIKLIDLYLIFVRHVAVNDLTAFSLLLDVAIFIFTFFYNKFYFNHLLNNDYKVISIHNITDKSELSKMTSKDLGTFFEGNESNKHDIIKVEEHLVKRFSVRYLLIIVAVVVLVVVNLFVAAYLQSRSLHDQLNNPDKKQEFSSPSTKHDASTNSFRDTKSNLATVKK